MSDIGTILVGMTPKSTAGGRGQRQALINISGTSGATPGEDTKQTILDKYVPVGAFSFNVASARGFKAGDKVLVRRIGNQDLTKQRAQVESMDTHVGPRSLYLTQLKERLGIEAVNNVMKIGQTVD
jgi:hypothetical protein